eukprot:13944023-Ditylum_brightwellii.AAC.1
MEDSSGGDVSKEKEEAEGLLLVPMEDLEADNTFLDDFSKAEEEPEGSAMVLVGDSPGEDTALVILVILVGISH